MVKEAVMQNKAQEYVFDADVADTEGIVYVNWMYARNLKGFLWMWRAFPRIGKMFQRADGLADIHVAMVSPFKVIVVSHWDNMQALHDAYRDPIHIDMMKWIYANPDALALGNETYGAPVSTRYFNADGGFARITDAKLGKKESFIKKTRNATA